MGQALAIDGCCAPDRASSKRTNGKKKPQECYGPPMFEGDVISLSYTEWEEIIALSRAVTPGGKLLGLSSTKKMLCTLHQAQSTMLLPGFGTTAQHFYSIKLWEVNKQVGGVGKLRSQLSSSSGDGGGGGGGGGSSGSSDGGDGGDGGAAAKTGSSSGSGSGSSGDGSTRNASIPKATPVALFEIEPGTKVHQVVVLDSANPQYIAATCSRMEPVRTRQQGSSSLTTHHEVRLCCTIIESLP